MFTREKARLVLPIDGRVTAITIISTPVETVGHFIQIVKTRRNAP